jgi:hypothetical protein
MRNSGTHAKAKCAKLTSFCRFIMLFSMYDTKFVVKYIFFVPTLSPISCHLPLRMTKFGTGTTLWRLPIPKVFRLGYLIEGFPVFLDFLPECRTVCFLKVTTVTYISSRYKLSNWFLLLKMHSSSCPHGRCISITMNLTSIIWAYA